ncbi:ATP-dependent DNA helicase RecG [bacterium]|nr:ATP-dependent DNA helicase RecG [bacterium]
MYAGNKAKPPSDQAEQRIEHGSLETPVQFVPGVGPHRARQLERVGVHTLEDLLYYLPRRYLDRSLIVPINGLDLSDREFTVIGKVSSFRVIGGGPASRRLELDLIDETGALRAVWFRGLHYWTKAFERGQVVAFSGKAQVFRDRLQMVHPAVDFLDESERLGLKAKTGTIISLYSSDHALRQVGLDSRGIRRIVAAATEIATGRIPEMLPAELLQAYGLLDREKTLRQVHFPESMELKELALKRLRYEELFSVQLTLALRQHQRKNRQKGIKFPHPGASTRKAVKSLPFDLTKGQLAVLTDIRQDMESDYPMNRLLQGDVGAGKTVVAMIALCMAVEGGYQGVIMAPTEVLAEQHFRTLTSFFEPLGIPTTLLYGSLPAAVKRERLRRVASGEVDIAIGTHALIQEKVEFERLGLAIIDEQHRFGVAQRLKLRQKGVSPDVLVLTATPIPRSLALTLYGDLDVSLLKERPKHRKPIQTRILGGRERQKLFDFLKTELKKKRQGFLVYPLVDTSEKLDLQAAVTSYEKLKIGELKDFSLGLIHGRMTAEEKDNIMTAFSAGEIDLLVATSVIEVGIDIPNATVMAVMSAQRFGLAQLHQLRGRVGRGNVRGVCVLVIDPPVTREAQDRLSVLANSEDGFEIAEADLQIRGGGEFFGTRQHGAPDFRIADPIAHQDLLVAARRDAQEWVAKDPSLKSFKPLRSHFERAYGPRMELMDVG